MISSAALMRWLRFPSAIRYAPGMSRALPLLSALILVLAGCGDDGSSSDGGVGRTDGGGGTDAGARDANVPPPACVDALPVDILWVVDNSHSMREEQVNLAAQFPALVDTLTNPPDTDRDGMPDYPPVTDIQMAVITTDLGVGDQVGVPNCDATGDAGDFITASRASEGECVGYSLPGGADFLSFTDAETFSSAFGCLVSLGTDGCGWEQQLEASYRAVVDNGSSFLREDSLVLIMFVTDEDDCSTTDTSLFDPSPAANATLGPGPRRCAENADRLTALSRYTGAFHDLELDRPGNVLVGAITGVPRDLVSSPIGVDYAAVLADARMQIQVDPSDANKLAPACEFGGVGSAPPGRRLVQVVQDFGQNGILASICDPDLTDTMQAIGELVAARICDAPI